VKLRRQDLLNDDGDMSGVESYPGVPEPFCRVFSGAYWKIFDFRWKLSGKVETETGPGFNESQVLRGVLAMNKEKKRYDTDKSAAKKEVVLKAKKKKKFPHIVVLAVAGVLIASGLTFFLSDKGNESSVSASAGSLEPAATAAEISFPVELFSDGQARFYKYGADDGINIRFFVLKSSDGVIRAAFDACDVCWRAGKGYYQEGDFMVCRNCGRRFASVKVNEVKGGCNPAPLERTVVDDKLVLQVANILQGKQYFDFVRGS
jgi:uncharacterized membrane protein